MPSLRIVVHVRFEAIRRLWERLQSGGARSLEDAVGFTESELAFGRLVLPLLEDLESTKRMLDEVARRARTLEAALDHIPVAALILDDEGRLLTTNRAARELFGGPAITASVLAAAARAARDGPEGAAPVLPHPDRKTSLRFVPAEVADGLPEGDEGAVVFVIPADGPALVDPASLARFGLTRMETSVVGLVVAGCTNREASEGLGLSIETVRSHLASAYRKTGARNRAALVALAFGARFGQTPAP